jgi:hypothetical protein
MLVRAGEPIAQIGRCLVRGFAVEGHHRRWDAGYPNDAGAPAFFCDPCHLNEVTPASNYSFESMPHDFLLYSEFINRGGSNSTRLENRNKRKDVRKRPLSSGTKRSTHDLAKNIFLLSFGPQDIDASSTGFPHTLRAPRVRAPKSLDERRLD